MLRDRLFGLARAASVDRAVAYAVAGRIWALVSGIVTLFLIVTRMTPEQQGYHYTFASLVALQSFVELGFFLVLTQFASHEWAHLRLDDRGGVVGHEAAQSRLVSLVRFAARWYAAVTIAFVIGVGSAGYYFLSTGHQTSVAWVTPWVLLVAFTGAQLWLLPIFSILEGCGQVRSVYLMRLAQIVASSLGLWITLLLRGGIFAAGVGVACGLSANGLLLLYRHRPLLRALFSRSSGPTISWRREIWPMQWRLAASTVVSYFAFSLFTPVIFRYHGAVEAGRVGLTWQAISAASALAAAWLSPQIPRFGVLIARREFRQLDRHFARAALTSLGVAAIGSLAILVFIVLLNALQLSAASRFLPPLPAALFLMGGIGMHLGQCLAAYLRAHKRDPLLLVSVSSGLLFGLLVWLLGSRYGAVGEAVGYVAVVWLFVVPGIVWTWRRCRRLWHTAPALFAGSPNGI